MTYATTPDLRAETRALLLSTLTAVFWGSNFEATRIALHSLPPWSAAAGRFALAAMATLIWMWAREGSGLAALRRNGPMLALLGLIGVAGFNAALFLGMQSATPVTAALIMATTPLSTTLIEALLSRKAPGLRALTGMGVGLLGVGLTVGIFSGATLAPGDLLVLGGSLCFSVYTVGCRRWVSDASALEITTWTMIAGAVALIVAACIFEDPLRAYAAASPAGWGATLWMALLGSTVAFAFWQTGIRVRGAAATSVLFNLVPVSALMIAAAFGRIPDLTQMLGVALAIAGVLWASGGRRAA